MFDIKVLKELYKQNYNLIEYMKSHSSSSDDALEQIMISYDIQAGTYAQAYYKNPDHKKDFLARFAEIILEKQISGSILEAGVGEATSLVPLLNILAEKSGKNIFDNVFGFDISWSRLKAAKQFSQRENQNNLHFFTGELQNIPLKDNSFNLVYTNHAAEPNGGQEREILQELYRVCKDYLILLEPCYEFADENAQARMKKHGYVTHLYETAKELNYQIELYELYDQSTNPLNPTGIMIIQKQLDQTGSDYSPSSFQPYVCPVSKKALTEYADSFYSPESMLAYPIIQGIPCLLTNNAIVATQYLNESIF